ncbi:MAG: hypothetical protein HY727_04650 [Candidatus Rokubacteria bacterium]|nr:hypothetical protein [Candidatus Rokubacteria bacterium]
MATSTSPDHPSRPSRLASWTTHLTLSALDHTIAILGLLLSPPGLVWTGGLLVLAGAAFSWLQTPLQGVIRGYAYPIGSTPALSDGLTNPVRPLSFALLCVLAVALAAVGRVWTRAEWLPRYAGGTLLIVVLALPMHLIANAHAFVQLLVDQGAEREAIRTFALLVGGYSATIPELSLQGTSSPLETGATVFQVIGYGWWFTCWGAALMLLGGVAGMGTRRGNLFVASWLGIALAVLSGVTGRATLAEYYRLRGEGAYAKGQYGEALASFRAALDWLPALRDNVFFQYRVGATLYWLGDNTSPAARMFLADNLSKQKEYDKAELQLKLALAAEPESKFTRTKLASLYADWGVSNFKKEHVGALPRWEGARDLDPNLLRLPYFFGAAYFLLDDRDQSRTIAEYGRLLARIGERGVRADVHGLLGNAYFKAHRDAEAREAYRASMAEIPLVKQLNLQAQKGLIGL